MGFTLLRKNLLEEQIFSYKSGYLLRREEKKNEENKRIASS